MRDTMGTGLGAKPDRLSTDVFCFGPPDLAAERSCRRVRCMPPPSLLKGVVAGVRDYGNRMGIPTANGSVRVRPPNFIGNPLVFVRQRRHPVDRANKVEAGVAPRRS